VTVRQVLIYVNILAVAAFAIAAFLLLRRHPEEEKTPANLTPFLADEDLESRRLERVLGWSLICAAAIAVTLPIYWLREPDRQRQSETYFDRGAIERGATLFAGPGGEAYDSTVSLQCANCHGSSGEGGFAPNWLYTVDDKGTADTKDDVTIKVPWRAPALNTVLLRFSDEEVRGIITYGRPGTPMQPFGVEGGGPKNAQSIGDLIAFLHSIQLTPKEAQAQALEQLDGNDKTGADRVVGWRNEPAQQLADARQALTDAQDALDKLKGDDKATSAQLRDAQQAVDDAQAAVAWAEDWVSRRSNVTDGQLLYELFCARCHTKGWSIFDPTVPDTIGALGRAGGGGSIGFNLRGSEVGRFADPKDQVDFVSIGSDAYKPYGDNGNSGNGSGKMPGFGGTNGHDGMLTLDMIRAIVEYERHCLDVADPSQPAARQRRLADVPACNRSAATLKEVGK
jgi:mono/diheme cytochrome c family protein